MHYSKYTIVYTQRSLNRAHHQQVISLSSIGLMDTISYRFLPLRSRLKLDLLLGK